MIRNGASAVFLASTAAAGRPVPTATRPSSDKPGRSARQYPVTLPERLGLHRPALPAGRLHDPVTGAGRLCGDLALAAVSLVLGLSGRARRPARSAPDHPGRHAAVHRMLARLGPIVHDGHARALACRRSVLAAWNRGRVVGAGFATLDPSHRRAGAVAQRGATLVDVAGGRAPWRAGGGRSDAAGVRTFGERHHRRAHVPAADAVACACAVQAQSASGDAKGNATAEVT